MRQRGESAHDKIFLTGTSKVKRKQYLKPPESDVHPHKANQDPDSEIPTPPPMEEPKEELNSHPEILQFTPVLPQRQSFLVYFSRYVSLWDVFDFIHIA